MIEKIGFADIVEDVVEDFEEKGYLDDYEKAKSYASQHSNYGAKKLSLFSIKWVLIERPSLKF